MAGLPAARDPDADLGPGRTLRQGREYHSFQRARDALFALMRLAEPKLDRGSSVRKTFTGKVRELFADLLDDSVEPFTHFFVKQLAKWSVHCPRAAVSACTLTLTTGRSPAGRSADPRLTTNELGTTMSDADRTRLTQLEYRLTGSTGEPGVDARGAAGGSRFSTGRDSFFADVIAAADSHRFSCSLLAVLRDRIRGTVQCRSHSRPKAPGRSLTKGVCTARPEPMDAAGWRGMDGRGHC